MRSFIIMVQRGCDQLVKILQLVGGEVSGRQHQQPSGSSRSGVYVFVGSIPLTSPTCWGFQHLQNSSKTLLCICLEGEPGPCPKAALLFLLTGPPLSGHTLPSLICNCLIPSLGTQGRSWRLNEAYSCNQEMGGTERFLCPGAPPAWH